MKQSGYCASAISLLWLLAASLALGQSSAWPQWGGPQRNFKSEAKGLAASWPAGGPARHWSRPLGDGYSSIVVDEGKLFTLYRQGKQEIVVALDASTGQTIWEYSYDAGLSKEFEELGPEGEGPRATPLVAGNQLFTAGVTGKLLCLDKQTGRVNWARELIREFGGALSVNGYAGSPLAYRDSVILMVGGKGQSIVALNQKDGSVKWSKHDFKNSLSSPILIDVDGQTQLVAFMYGELAGVDPDTGDLLWSHPHPTEMGRNISTPVWGEDNLLFCSSAADGGSRVLKLARDGSRTTVREVWFHRQMRVQFGNVIRLGDYVYGSSGETGPAFLTAANVKTGEIIWRDRNFSRASLLYADGRFIILDEEGNLALATPGADGLRVQARATLLSKPSLTVPTLVGTRLYARDRKTIMALDLR
jgi:outer membrane protein assembly factor BamB